MKNAHAHLKIKKKVRLSGIKRLKNLIRDDVHSCLKDIVPYLVTDILRRLKKEGILYAKKQKKNTKKSKKRIR